MTVDPTPAAAAAPHGDPIAPALAFEDVAFRYPDGSEALVGVDLTIAPGERVALLGPNGAGKTTLTLHANGILRASKGRVRVGGIALSDGTVAEVRRRVGLVFQDPDDQLFMPSVAEDVGFGPANAGLAGAELAERVAEALAAVGLPDHGSRAPHHLSGGERRRVAIATVLASHPEIIVLDEPTSGLDPASRRELIERLRSLDVAQLVVTHDLPLALELCPRSLVLDAGRVVVDLPTRELLADARLLAEHRLELPYGMDPALLRR
ncbi:MAG: hypothetical protein RLZZ272_473 [Actinomycetota bacterium]|jgi:cobalt/nickel transport system ATP-binding protein